MGVRGGNGCEGWEWVLGMEMGIKYNFSPYLYVK